MIDSPPIKTIAELQRRLESLLTALDARALTLHQYEQVGWAARHIEALLDRCREEAQSSSWYERRVQLFQSLWPNGPTATLARTFAEAAANALSRDAAHPTPTGATSTPSPSNGASNGSPPKGRPQ